MYGLLKRLALTILKVPPEPEDPMGAVNTLVIFRASPNFFKYRLLVWMLKMALGALGYIIFIGFMVAGTLNSAKHGAALPIILELGFIAVLLFVYTIHVFTSYVVLRLDYEMRWYKVTDRSLRIREGVVQVREITMTFANIQNISVSQGPIQRLFKIADLKVETAGGGGGGPAQGNHSQEAFSDHTAFFRGVDNIEEIKNLMLERLKKYRDSGLGDTDDPIVATGEADADSAIATVLKSIRDETAALRTAAEKFHPPPGLTSAKI